MLLSVSGTCGCMGWEDVKAATVDEVSAEREHSQCVSVWKEHKYDCVHVGMECV